MISRLLSYINQFWYFAVVSAIGSIVYAACDACSVYLIKPLLNTNINLQFSAIIRNIFILFLILFFLRSIGFFFASYFVGKLGLKVTYIFRKKIFNKFLYLPAQYYDNNKFGKLLSNALYNIDQINNCIGKSLLVICQDVTFIIGLIVIMLFISLKLTISIVVITPLLIFAIHVINKFFQQYSRNIQLSMENLTHITEETLFNYKEIRIFGCQNYQQNKFCKQLHYTYIQQLRILFINSLTSPIIQFFVALIVILSLFMITIFFSLCGSQSCIDSGSFASFFASVIAILKPVKNLVNINIVIQKAFVAAEDIFYILDYSNEQDIGRKILFNVSGNICFKNVSFYYLNTPSKIMILKDINFSIQSKQTVALIGNSGSGKTTIVNLLTKFYLPTAGKILLDNKDINDIELKNLRSHISLVSQHVNLFYGTIYDNIIYGIKGHISKSEVIEATKCADAFDFIESLPYKFDTFVGQNGFNLSGGQRQRVAIVRAILKNAPILILDEPTSSLDNRSIKIMQYNLNDLMKNKTVLIITHKLTTLCHTDNIIILDHGRIIDSVSYNYLISRKK